MLAAEVTARVRPVERASRSLQKKPAADGHGKILSPEPITIDPHYSPQFYAELWGTSPSTVVRRFQDREGVLRKHHLHLGEVRNHEREI